MHMCVYTLTFNSQRTCARDTVVVLCVCVCMCAFVCQTVLVDSQSTVSLGWHVFVCFSLVDFANNDVQKII